MLRQWRGTQRYVPLFRADEDALTRNIIALASEYGRYGYRRITALLKARGWIDRQGPSATDLAARRVESAAETKGASEVVVERWNVRSVAAGTRESCVELRFRLRDDARRKNAADADAD